MHGEVVGDASQQQRSRTGPLRPAQLNADGPSLAAPPVEGAPIKRPGGGARRVPFPMPDAQGLADESQDNQTTRGPIRPPSECELSDPPSTYENAVGQSSKTIEGKKTKTALDRDEFRPPSRQKVSQKEVQGGIRERLQAVAQRKNEKGLQSRAHGDQNHRRLLGVKGKETIAVRNCSGFTAPSLRWPLQSFHNPSVRMDQVPKQHAANERIRED